MSDRTSAAIFGEIIELLDSPNSMSRKTLIRKVFEASEHYNFRPGDMDVDDILVKHKLAQWVGDEGAIVYKGRDYP